MRSFGIADVTPEELQEAFPEIAAVSAQCRWRPCLHREGQNGCAVATAPGIEPERLASYRRILEELEARGPAGRLGAPGRAPRRTSPRLL